MTSHPPHRSDVLRRESLYAAGWTESAVRAQLDANRWQAVTSTVVALHNGPLPERQRRAAAVLTAGPDAALAAWTALGEGGLHGWDRPEIHVVVPRGARPPSFGTLRVRLHESRRTFAVVVAAGSVPRTSAARSAVDAAGWSSSPRTACGVLAATVQQGLARPEQLERELLACLRLRHRRLLLTAVRDMAGGAQAVSELDFLSFCRRHRFGRPVLQEVRRDAAGRRRYLDATLRSRSGRRVREIDGALHLAVGSYWDDMRRSNDLLLVGEPLLRFPSVAIVGDDPHVVRQLRQALAA